MSLKTSRTTEIHKRRGLAIGLTGGIACGKTETGQILKKLGVRVQDADDIAHDLMARNEPVYERIVRHFGQVILDENGEIDRRKLGRRVFQSESERVMLNRIVHPPARAVWREWVEEAVVRGGTVVVIIPLLYEIGDADYWDVVICVSAPEAAVRRRLRERGCSETEVQARLAAQMPLDAKIQRADYVIRNEGTLDQLETGTGELLKFIQEKER